MAVKVADVAARLFIFLFCLSLLPQTVPMKLFTLFFVCVFSFVAAEEDERLPNKCEGRTKKRCSLAVNTLFVWLYNGIMPYEHPVVCAQTLKL